MAVTATRLAVGTAPLTATTVYTVGASTTTIATSIMLHNTDSSTRTVQVYFRVSATNYRIIYVDLAPDASLYWNERSVLETTDEIQIEASAASVVNYYISGAEITP